MAQITTNRVGSRIRVRARAAAGKVHTLGALAITGLACLVLTGTARAQSSINGWGVSVFDSAWNSETAFVEVVAGYSHTVARRSDGSVVAWGDNQYWQCDVPAPPAGLTYVEVAAGARHTVARRSDGSVVWWGNNSTVSVPAPPNPENTPLRLTLPEKT